MVNATDASPVFDYSVNLSAAPRIWAVGAVHGQVDTLTRLHDALAVRFVPGDRLIYLGNVLGGGDVIATLAEVFRFRRSVLALPPLYLPEDIVFLRGQQEEMWHKLLQIHFAPKPKDLLSWMLPRGVEATLTAYGGDRGQGFAAAAEGMVALTRWTARLKAAMQAAPGHQPWFADLRRYAHTGPSGVLFVHAGLDPARPVAEQRDAFWWESASFASAARGYVGFARVVRGYDPEGGGWREDGITLTIDGGCGRGGVLTAVCLSPTGEMLDRIDVEQPAD